MHPLNWLRWVVIAVVVCGVAIAIHGLGVIRGGGLNSGGIAYGVGYFFGLLALIYGATITGLGSIILRSLKWHNLERILGLFGFFISAVLLWAILGLEISFATAVAFGVAPAIGAIALSVLALSEPNKRAPYRPGGVAAVVVGMSSTCFSMLFIIYLRVSA